MSTVKFVKLAGMEYLKIGKEDGKKHKSLAVLRNVLKLLVEQQAGRSSNINYTESVLTDSLK
jgi:hypothetical protein